MKKLIVAILGIIVVFVIVIGAGVLVNRQTTTPTPTIAPTAIPTTTLAPTVVPTPEIIPNTWVMVDSPSDTSWVVNGVAKIKNAKTQIDAIKAINIWVNRIKRSPVTLAGAIQYIYNKEVDMDSLVRDGWATDEAIKWVTAIQAKLGEAKITIINAPIGWVNSGVRNGKVVPTSKVDKKLKALGVKFKDGSRIAIIGICGNIATPKRPVLPTPTPKPKLTPKPTPKPTVKPTPTLAPKDPSQDPAVKGNAPNGGGKNQDPGPGTYIAPDKMTQPPAITRVNPSPPVYVIAPTPRPSIPAIPAIPAMPVTADSTIKIPVGSTPDSAPAPTPEKKAPSKDNPGIGYSPPPGT